MNKTVYLVSLLVVFYGQVVTSQQYNFKRYSIEEGLPRSGVYSIIEDSKGFLWIATEGGGASVFDGEKFTTYTLGDGLGHNVIRCVFEDDQGNIWFGTQGKGVAKFDGRQFTNYDISSGLSHNVVRSIGQDNQGNLWFGTFGGGICKFNLKNKDLEEGIVRCYTTSDGLLHNRVRAILKDSKGYMWFGTDGGISRFNGRTFDNYTTEDGLLNNRILSIYEDGSKNLWFGTQDGVVLYDGSKFVVYTAEDGLIHNRIRAICQDNYGNMWFGTASGISKMVDNKFYNYTENEGLSNARVRSIIRTSTGDLWFGTFFGGINRYSGEMFIHYTENQNLVNNQANAVATDQQNNIWIGTYEGVSKIEFRNGRFTIRNITEEDGLVNNVVRSIMVDNRGYIWFGTENGISIYKEFIRRNIDEFDGLSNTEILAMIEDTENRYWVGTAVGLSNIRFTGDNQAGIRIRNYSSKEGFPEIPVTVLYEDLNGNIWMGFENNGFAVLNENSIVRYRLPENQNNVSAITDDQSGTLWVGTVGGGIFYYTLTSTGIDTTTKRNISIADGLRSNSVHLLAFDDNENLWVGSEKGVDKISFSRIKEIIRIKHFGREEGFLGIETHKNAVCKDHTGNLWFGTIKGLTRYNPFAEETSSMETYTHITSVEIPNQDIIWENSEYADGISGRFGLPQKLILPYNRNSIAFEFIGIYLKSPNNVQYKWKLEGFNDEWSIPSRKHDMIYTNLAQGDYIFMVKSSNEDDIWNEFPVTFEFSVEPPFWKTWWFYTLITIFGLALIVAYIKIRERNLVREKRILEEKVKERTAEVVHQKEEIEAQRDEIEAQRDLATQQRDMITQQKQEITDSIHYARRIQSALLPPTTIIANYLSDFFILFKPKDIVSGDFYWMTEKNDKLVITAVDCTGHGVPGAFMSMLGVSYLTEIVNKTERLNANEILNQLRHYVIESLRQRKGELETKDGMDMALCIIDCSSQRMEYAGANNPLYLVRNGTIIETKGDKMPIGIHVYDSKPFTNHQFDLESGDSVYIFSDGYADQFGGPEGKKFKYQSLRNIFIENNHLTMQEQRKILDKTFEEWKGNLPQVDDVVIVGFKL
ncbi:MAG: SpoIIE family protein phosphatase [Bacteroidales bacterium]|nr:MAG: SpoIIE family protein phosphatase [Bacteroidales bacterium]